MQEEPTGQEIYENNLINRWVEKYMDTKKQFDQYKKSKQASYEALQARCNELEMSNRKLKQEILNKIEKVIAPYQEPIEADCLSLPSAVKSILERKTQECEELMFKCQNLEKRRISILKKVYDYEHALDEIEEIISTIMETNKIYPLQANLGKILYIIQDSKAKGNENDR